MKRLAILACLLVFSSQLHAAVRCADVKWGSPHYAEKMEELAQRAHLPDNYFNRYHEDVVVNLCTEKNALKDLTDSKKIIGLKTLIDDGYVEASEVESIKNVLGLSNRSEGGQSFGYSKQRFIKIGLCNACADNVARYYTKKPESKCGVLARKALEGNPSAIEDLLASPKYCEWKY